MSDNYKKLELKKKRKKERFSEYRSKLTEERNDERIVKQRIINRKRRDPLRKIAFKERRRSKIEVS